jgi:serralysin
MATYTTNFSSWSDFEDRIAAFQDYEDSYAYQAVQNVAADLTYDLFFADPYSYTFSATSITAYYYGATAHLYGSNFGTASATVTRADITNGTYTLVLKGSVNVGGVNPTGTITSLDLSGGGYSEHAVGQIPLSGLNGVFNSWSNTYPTALGSLTLAGTGTRTVSSSGNTTTTYSAISLADGAGNTTSLSGLKFTISDNSSTPVDYVELMRSLLGGNDTANGSTGNNELYTFAGNDTLDGKAGADTMVGGAGNDIYIVDSIGDLVVEDPSQGTDLVKSSIDYQLPDNVENLTLTATAAINATGNELANILTGNAGNNTLDGGAGIDTLIGGLGNDTYIVDLTETGTLQDILTEAASAGSDTVQLRGSAELATAATLTLAATLEHLDASATGSTKLNLTGNTLANNLTGNDADNTLTGGAGADSLVGGLGDDSYGVDNALDKVTENDGEGTDTVLSSVTWTLAAHIEHLTLTGAAAINATGNELANILTGNAAANILNGGSGADTMTGGNGNDTYVVDDIGDVVDETSTLAAGGNDLVQSAIGYELGANLERLTLTGSAAINGTGNALANLLTGNTGNNTLDGGDGKDTLVGGLGDDTYLADLTATGALQDIITEAASAGTDSVVLRGSATLVTAATLTLAATLEHLDASATGTAKLNLTGNTLANTLTGNDADNTLTGGTGNDALIGGLGNDTYVLDNAGDAVTENADEGTDLVRIAIATANQTYILGDHVENGTLINTVAFNLTGNDAGNTLTGNAAINTLTGGDGNDTLIGGAGADSLVGGLGDDSYGVDNALDKITENDDEGTDSVQSSVTWTLAAHIEHLTLTGAAAINATGNELDNILTGNAAANVLSGNDGNDALHGAAGNDRLDGGNGNDLLEGGAGKDALNGGAGNDTFIFSVALNKTTNIDTVADFASGLDVLQLAASVFTALGPAGALDPSFFHTGTSAHDADDHIIFNAATGALYYDPDGTGATLQVQFATLAGAPVVVATDFVVGF